MTESTTSATHAALASKKESCHGEERSDVAISSLRPHTPEIASLRSLLKKLSPFVILKQLF